MKDAALFTAVVVLLIVIPTAGILWVSAMLAFPGEQAQIEQLRRDAAVVDPAQAEDVIGQVTQWNQKITWHQAYNDVAVIGIFIPDEWDKVELISVPNE